MVDLDSIESIRSLDPGNMYNAIFDMPEHMAEAMRLSAIWKVDPAEFSEIKNVVMIGMGGSAISGDLARSLLAPSLMVPLTVHRHYILPEYVDDETLVIASSYSGNTEETVAACEDALQRKAMLAAVTTGGLLKEISDINQVPLCEIPVGLQPRAAIGYLFCCPMLFLEKVGLAPGFTDDLKQMIGGLQKYRDVYIEDNPAESNTAKALAKRIQGKTVVIYTGPTLTDGVGTRFKGQLCENGKQLAWANQFSEFNHNEFEGWSKSVEPIQEHLAVIILRDAEDMPQIRTRMNIVRDHIKDLGIDVIELHTKGQTRVERMFSLIQLGDFISYYLAILNDTDPTPVLAIEAMKLQLAETKFPS